MVTRSMCVTTTTSFLSSMVLLAVTDTIDLLSLVQQTITTGQSATDTNTIQACQHRHNTDTGTTTAGVCDHLLWRMDGGRGKRGAVRDRARETP